MGNTNEISRMTTRALTRCCAVVCALLMLFGGAKRAYAEAKNTLTEADGTVIEVTDRFGLERIAENPHGSYRLMRNIGLGGEEWTPFDFFGTLDGNGYAIYNVSITQAGERVGMGVDGNHHRYDTVFCGFFASIENATIHDLKLYNVQIDVSCVESCFAGCIAGSIEDSVISDCEVIGSIDLKTSGGICGTGGLVGYGNGEIVNTNADVTLVLTDTNGEENSEAFLGGACACGCIDLENCYVSLDGYASVSGYAHNGGLIGMYHAANRGRKKRGFIRGCSVEGAIRFYEDNVDRRAYCKALIGEDLEEVATIRNNKTDGFVCDETKDCSVYLKPEMCASPEWSTTLKLSQKSEFGWFEKRCENCGHTYRYGWMPPLDIDARTSQLLHTN